MMKHRLLTLAAGVAALLMAGPVAAQDVFQFGREFPLTDFSKRSIPLSEIKASGDLRRGSFPTIYEPLFTTPDEALATVGPLEPVLSIGIDGDFRAYPLQIMLWHELVNDVVGGVPVLVTYCPLCNSGVVYDRRLNGEVLTFDNTGRLRHLDMVIYDLDTESWWQQFLGESIIGANTGQRLTPLPARLESLQRFAERAPDGQVLVPPPDVRRPYGQSSHSGTDDVPPALARNRYPFDMPADVSPLERLVVVGEEAWRLADVRDAGAVEAGDLVLTWIAGQNSAHDTQLIANGRDVGNVVVQRRSDDGLQDVPYDVAFAYSFVAFVPQGTLHLTN